MQIPNSLHVLVVLLASVIISGCALRHEPPPGVVANPSVRSVAIARARLLYQELSSLRLLTKTRVLEQESSSVIRQAFVLDHTPRTRIDILPLQGAFTLGVLVVKPGEALYLDPGRKIAVTADDAGDLLEEAFSIPVDQADILPLLSGRLPPSVLDDIALEVRVLDDGDLLFIRKTGDERWRVDPSSGALRAVELRGGWRGRVALDAHYGELAPEQGIMLPHTITLNLPRIARRYELSLQRAVPNAPIDEQLFAIAIPGDFRHYRR